MNQIITATFDGKTFHPDTTLDLMINQRYQLSITPIDESESDLIKSAELYAEIYAEDEDLQELTESALIE